VFIANDGRTIRDRTEIAAQFQHDMSLGLPLKANVRHVFVGDDTARLAPPFDGEVVEARFGEMMRDDFCLGRYALGLIAQEFRGTAMQRLPAALEQAVVGRVLDQRVLEAVVRLRACALGDKEVRAGEPVERRLEGDVVKPADSVQQRMGEISPQDGADLRDFTRRPKPVESRRERLLQGRRD
jgi:hypothetical protein